MLHVEHFRRNSLLVLITSEVIHRLESVGRGAAGSQASGGFFEKKRRQKNFPSSGFFACRDPAERVFSVASAFGRFTRGGIEIFVEKPEPGTMFERGFALIGVEGFRRFLPVVRRAPLARLALFLLIVLLFIVPFEIILGFIPGKESFPASVLALITAFAFLLALLYRWLVQVFEDRDASELSLQPLFLPLFLGMACGLGLFSSVIGILTVAGIAQFHGVNNPEGFLKSLIINVHGAVFEEILFRGIIYRLLEERFGSAISLFLSAILFGLVHLDNPGADLISTAAIALTAGLLLPLAFCASRTLWMPIGLHFAWNFTESGLFDLDVSGFDLHGLVKTSLVGPTSLTGGRFGPEASIVAVGVCLIASVAFGRIVWRRGNWMPMRIKTR